MENLRELLYQKGASLVGLGKVDGLYATDEAAELDMTDMSNEEWIIPHYPVGISIAIAIPKEVIKGIANRPTMDYYHTYHELNKRLDFLAEYCEGYLRNLGYQAYAQTTSKVKEYGCYKTAMPHKTVSVASGLGWIGKSALLVTKEFGSAVRLTSVLTDAPLVCNDEIYDTPCRNCDLCKNACPGKAITGNVWDSKKDRAWIFDALACRTQARKIAFEELGKEITLCGKCIEVCPYTQRYLNSNE